MSPVVLSLALFVRGLWILDRLPAIAAALARIVPHVIDAVADQRHRAGALILHQYLFVHGWLTAKVLGLTAYIIRQHRPQARPDQTDPRCRLDFGAGNVRLHRQRRRDSCPRRASVGLL